MSHRKNRLRGHSALVQSQFGRTEPKVKRHSPGAKLRRQLMSAARDALLKSAEWCESNEYGWALVMVEKAEALLKAAKAIDR
jgi:hypothetical protein